MTSTRPSKLNFDLFKERKREMAVSRRAFRMIKANQCAYWNGDGVAVPGMWVLVLETPDGGVENGDTPVVCVDKNGIAHECFADELDPTAEAPAGIVASLRRAGAKSLSRMASYRTAKKEAGDKEVFTVEAFDDDIEDDVTPMKYLKTYYSFDEAVRAAKKILNEFKSSIKRVIDNSRDNIVVSVFGGEYEKPSGDIYGEPVAIWEKSVNENYRSASRRVAYGKRVKKLDKGCTMHEFDDRFVVTNEWGRNIGEGKTPTDVETIVELYDGTPDWDYRDYARKERERNASRRVALRVQDGGALKPNQLFEEVGMQFPKLPGFDEELRAVGYTEGGIKGTLAWLKECKGELEDFDAELHTKDKRAVKSMAESCGHTADYCKDEFIEKGVRSGKRLEQFFRAVQKVLAEMSDKLK